MVAYVFDRLLAQGVRAGQVPARSQQARNWYRDAAKKTTTSPSRLMRGDAGRLKNRPAVGKMYAFFYDPKHKKTLPFYDTFPLIFPIKKLPDGFLGINLHYLPPRLRAKLMDALYDLTTNERYDEKTKLEISYELLNSAAKYKWFKPTVKRYLNKHIRSRFLLIEASEWDIALFLPTERFEKASKQEVWRESRNAI